MAKTWEELSPSEKIEDLRKDVTRIFHILTELRDAIGQDQSGLKSQIDVMRPWGPLLNQLMHRLNKIDGLA
jgi:hypothetical protein